MAFDFSLAALGLVILLLAGDALVRGAVNLSLRLGVPALIVSLTIVAFGTSAPELLISIKAVVEDTGGLALGNVVGSNIANVLMVLGVPALFAGLATAHCETKKSYLQMLAATALFIVVCFLGPITWVHGMFLLAGLAWMLWDAFSDARAHRAEGARVCNDPTEDEEEVEGADPSMPKWKIALYLVLGLVGLPLGAEILVDASTDIAEDFGVSETVIGLTLVAIGTSLPELATTVMAAIRKQADVALGNVIGSNMFNLLAIIGLTTLVGPIPVDPAVLKFDIWVMAAAALVLVPFVFLRMNISRPLGAALTVLYVTYLAVVI